MKERHKDIDRFWSNWGKLKEEQGHPELFLSPLRLPLNP